MPSMREIDEVTDDMIVDAVATFGFAGVWTTESADDPGDGFDILAQRLGLIGPKEELWERDDEDEIVGFLTRRIEAMKTRIRVDLAGTYSLTPEEWARRLVGLDMTQLTAAIRGRES